MVSVADKNWYVIRSVTGQEAKVKKYIMTELARVGLDKQVEDILVPVSYTHLTLPTILLV